MQPSTDPQGAAGTGSGPAEHEERLVAARTHARLRVAELSRTLAELIAASAGSNADDEHDPEGATIAFERAQLDSLLRRAQQHVAEVDAALARLAAGRYGVCTACGHDVPPARLEARPTALTCAACVRG